MSLIICDQFDLVAHHVGHAGPEFGCALQFVLLAVLSVMEEGKMRRIVFCAAANFDNSDLAARIRAFLCFQ